MVTTEALVGALISPTHHLTDVNVATSHGIAVDDLRRALKVLAFIGIVGDSGSHGAAGMTWHARTPSGSNTRAVLVRAEMAKALPDFLAAEIVRELEDEANAFTGPLV